MEPRLLAPDEELTRPEWLRRYALQRLKYGGTDKEMMLACALEFQQTVLTRDLLGEMLTSIANTIKGEPAAGCEWGLEDLPELVQLLKDGKPLPDSFDVTVQ